MDGISFTLEISGLDAALARLNAMGTVHFHELLFGLAQQGKYQTERRMRNEKTSPEGVAWKKTTDGRGALFVTGRFAHDYIQSEVSGDAAIWGSGWIAARIHQFGGVIKPVNAKVLAFNIGAKKVFAKKVTIPARPYIGVSAENARDLEQTALTFVAGVLSGRFQ
jgi:phage gpG-like protein